jgi:hypothetical protein
VECGKIWHREIYLFLMKLWRGNTKKEKEDRLLELSKSELRKLKPVKR